MAPKRNATKRVREPSPILEDWNITSENRYLFKNEEAYTKYMCSMSHRELALCYYFTKVQGITEPENGRIGEYIDH